MPASPTSASRLAPLLLAVAAAAVGAWIWTCLCRYPAQEWNEMRLAPSFLWHAGLSPYPGPADGPVTTWVYGPLPILLQLPAVLARNIVGAMTIASVVNLLVTVLPLAWAVIAAAPRPVRPSVVGWALLASLAAWPAANLIFCQADNAAIGFGLIAGALLAGVAAPGSARLWLAAGAATLALWSKQTELGPVLGQLVYLGLRFGWRQAAAQAGRCAAAGGLLGLVFCQCFGTEGLVYNMFALPGAFPWASLDQKVEDPGYRLHVLAYFAVYMIGPVFLLIRQRTFTLDRRRMSFLPALVFLFSLPFNLAGFLTVGGSVNSWHAAVYLLPVTTLWLAERPQFAAIFLSIALCFQAVVEGPLLWRPATARLQQGQAIAAQLPGQVYFPWNPLMTFFADQRIDHTEDGLLTRMAAGRPMSPQAMYAHLPPRWSVVATSRTELDDYLRRFVPIRAQRSTLGAWTLYSWAPSP